MKQELLTYIAIMILMKLCKSFSYITPRTYDIVRGSIMMKNNLRKLVSLTAAATSSSESIESAVTVDPVLDLLALELPTNDNSINLLKMRHTSAHVMAMAVQKVFPSVKVTIGPWIDNGYVKCSAPSLHQCQSLLSIQYLVLYECLTVAACCCRP